MAVREAATEVGAMRAVVHPVLMRLKPSDVFPAARLLYRASVTLPTINRGCDGTGLRLA